MLRPRDLYSPEKEKLTIVYKTWDWFSFAIPTPFVFMRLFVQFYILRKRGWMTYLRETLIFTAWLTFLISVAIYNEYIYTWLVEVNTDPQNVPGVMKIMKLMETAWILWFTSIFFCKMFLLLFYYDLIKRNLLPGLWLFNTCGLAFTVIGWVAVTLFQVLWCRPLNSMWRRIFDPSLNDNCIDVGVLEETYWGVHIVADFIVYGIPILLINQLVTLSRRKRAEAAIAFGLGFLSVACSVALMVISVQIMFFNRATLALETAYAMLIQPQITTALLVCCVMQVRIFVRWIAGKKGGRWGTQNQSITGVIEISGVSGSKMRKSKNALDVDDLETCLDAVTAEDVKSSASGSLVIEGCIGSASQEKPV